MPSVLGEAVSWLTWMDKAANGEITYSAYLNLGFARDRWDVLDEDATYR